MAIRDRILFAFLLLGFMPAGLLTMAVYEVGRHRTDARLSKGLTRDARQTAAHLRQALDRREQSVRALGASAVLIDLVSNAPAVQSDPGTAAKLLPPAVVDLFHSLDISEHGDLRAVYGYGADHRAVFAGERPSGTPAGQPFAIELGRSAAAVTLDPEAWNPTPPAPATVRNGIVRYYVPLNLAGGKNGLLAVDLSLANLLDELLPREPPGGAGYRIVLDRQGVLLADTRGNVRYQPVAETLPGFSPVAAQMTAFQDGQAELADQGTPMLAAFTPVNSLGLSLAVVTDPASASPFPRSLFWLGSTVMLICAGLAGYWFAVVMGREQRGIERVTQAAAAVAAGKLNQRIELNSSAELQALADGFNAMTDQLREQIARETEARQFRSFMRLSATVTHDLKNAIQSLTLLVKNLEARFDDPEFREQALRRLTGTTDRLNALVARLSEPMRSMSGELPRPQPADLAGMLRRVMRSTAELDPQGHELVVELPEKLIAEVDAERIEKVFENLIINALQAMETAPGKLTVRATTDGTDCTIVVADTGDGMSEVFLRDKLFRAFSTTKRTGIGLGLYTCREVVRAHGGTIEAESEVGSGTTFRVVLPLRAQAFWTNQAERGSGD